MDWEVRMRLSWRIPLIITILMAVALAIFGVGAERGGTRAIRDQQVQALTAVLHTRAEEIRHQTTDLYADLTILVESAEAQDGAVAFGEVVEEMSDPQGTLQRAFIHGNQFPEKERMLSALDVPEYSAVHQRLHPFFRAFAEARGYEDLYLVSPDGQVSYSVRKQADFATDLRDGPFSDSGLARVHWDIERARADHFIGAADFAFYVPAGDEPMAFLGSPVLNTTGEYIGSVILRISPDLYNGILLHHDGLGETGHTFLVGSDFRLRSANRFEEDMELIEVVETDAVKAAIGGESGSEELAGHDEEPALVVYESIRPFPNSSEGHLVWAAIAEMDLAEVDLPSAGLRQFLLITGALMLVGVALLTLVTARGVVRPIGLMSTALLRLSKGEDVEIPGQDRTDEIGEMADAAEVFKQMAEATAFSADAKTRLAALSSKMQKVDSLGEFGDVVLADLGGWGDAVAGAFYVWDENTELFGLVATYAFSQKMKDVQSFEMGEGFAGQAAKEGRIMLTKHVPEGHLAFTTAMGESSPEAVIALPFKVKDRVVGVAEFALLEYEASDVISETLDEMSKVIGLNLDNLQRVHRTRILLEETRQQAEELQASEEELRLQSEELVSTNEALNGQKQKLEVQAHELRASEEELRSQQEELQAINEALERRSEEVELARAEAVRRAEEVQQASTYKSQFLANMSHELRTPLNSMLILARDLADNHDGNLTEEQSEAAGIIHDSGTGLLRLINDILDLSKVEAGRMELAPSDFEIASLVGTLERLFVLQADDKGLSFAIDVAPDVPSVLFADPLRVEQIVVNLVGNALKFTSEGSVTVDITRPTEVPIKGAVPEEFVAITVKDTGIGIAEENVAAVFESFRQAEGTTARRFGGTGLGLPISRELAKLMGGVIHLVSAEGEGSTFIFYLPHRASEASHTVGAPVRAVRSEPTPRPAPEKVEQPAGVRGAMLIVEDDPILLRVLERIVEERGFNAISAASGAEAIARATELELVGVLLDLGLPDMDGWDVLDELKGDDRTKDIPVHVVSGREDVSEATERGAASYLPKPANRQQLTDLVDSVLSPGEQRPVLRVGAIGASWETVSAGLDASVLQLVADNAVEALAILDAEDIGCLIVDVDLPDMSAVEFLEQVKDRKIPVIVAASRDIEDEEDLALREFTDTIVAEGPLAGRRIIDEVDLFLHSVKQKEEVAPTVPSPIGGGGGFDGEQVLLVDDDMRNLFALSTALRRRGLKVLMAQDGFKALDQLDEHPNVDVVLMDVMMPEMDGLETTRRIRTDDRFGDLPIIALTAKAMAGDRETCLEAGCSDYMTKPVDVDKLTELIGGWLARTAGN